MNLIEDMRKAFMAGAARQTSWEYHFFSKTDWGKYFLKAFDYPNDFQSTDFIKLRNAFMAGSTRHTNWERYSNIKQDR